MVAKRMSWAVPGRDGWYVEIGPLPDRKAPYLTVFSPDGLTSVAKILGDREAELLASLLDEFASAAGKGVRDGQ